MSAPGTVTVLFSDLADSTAQASALPVDEAGPLRRRFYELLRAPIVATGGAEVKNTGDGLMVTFASAGAAVACAVATQQTMDRHNQRVPDPLRLRVRIGLSTGDAVHEDGDWFGASVVEAARLCAKAEPGQILAADVLRMLVRDGATFRAVGELELKGLPAPVPTCELCWSPLRGEEIALPLPARLEAVDTRFVGRVAERAAMHRALDDAAEARRRVVVLAGEPGIGKTALAAQAALEARRRGTTALYGRCEEGVGLPYQPFVEALDHFVAHGPADALERHVEEHGGALTRLAPRLARRFADVPPPRTSDPESERAMLFHAVTGLLREAARDEPLLLVLDDLHWADRETIRLLHHLVAASDGFSLTIVATYRPTDVDDEHPLRALLADLHRESGVERLDLAGLGDSDVEALLELLGGEGDRSVAREVRRRTSGNPFFVRELIREAAAAPDAVPSSVRDVIARRVHRLAPDARDLLATASVIGREFDLDLLYAAAGGGPDELADALDAAVHAALLEELPGAAGRFTFPHALVESTLYDEIGTARRRRLHERVALALEGICGDAPGRRVAELAHHWTQASSGASVAKPLHYATLAGDWALAHLAADEAVRWYRQALELLARAPEPEAGQERELRVRLGDAQRRSGDGAFRETLLHACELAWRAGDRERLVRAALLNNRGYWSRPGEVDPERVPMLERALEAVGPEDSSERALLLTHLGEELHFEEDRSHRFAASDEAIAIARRLGDARTLARVACGRVAALWAADTLADRSRCAEEGVAAAEHLGDPLPRFLALRSRANTRVECGDLPGAVSDLDAAETLAIERGLPLLRWQCTHNRTAITTIQGRFEDAERLAELQRDLGSRMDQPDTMFIYAAHLTMLRFEQGRLGELQPTVAATVESAPGVPAWRAALAIATVQAGLLDEAAAMIADELTREFPLPRDVVWSTGSAMWAIATSAVGNATAATLLYDRLAPYAGQVVFNGVNAWMTIDHHLGTLAAVAGRPDLARRHLADAAGLHERMGAPLWLERSRNQLARVEEVVA